MFYAHLMKTGTCLPFVYKEGEVDEEYNKFGPDELDEVVAFCDKWNAKHRKKRQRFSVQEDDY